MENKVDLTKQFDSFQSNLGKYEKDVSELLGTKFGITSQEFLIKVTNAIRKNPELLRCSSQSLFGSILYFAEIGLPFNTPEGYGYISAEFVNGNYEAVPIIGYRGLIEIAYRNPKVKSIRIQAVYSEDFFEYEYGTSEFIKHRPNYISQNNKKLVAVYAIAKLEGIEPMFVVVHKQQLDELKKLNKSNDHYKKFDVFNIMESKVAIKLLFKTLPKTDNETLLRVLDLDSKFDYDKNLKISATEEGYQLVEVENNTTALKDVDATPFELLEELPIEGRNSTIIEKKRETEIVANIELEKPFLTRDEIEGTSPNQVTSQVEVEEIQVLVTDKALEEDKLTRPEAQQTNEKFQQQKQELESFFDFSLIKKEPDFELDETKIERTSRWRPEFIEQLKPIEILQIETPKIVEKLTLKTQKELLELVVEVIEPIDLTLS